MAALRAERTCAALSKTHQAMSERHVGSNWFFNVRVTDKRNSMGKWHGVARLLRVKPGSHYFNSGVEDTWGLG